MILKNATLVAAVATSEPMISTNAREISLEGGRLRVVLATVVINAVAVSILTFAPGRTGARAQHSTSSTIVFLVGFAPVNIVEITFLRRYIFTGWDCLHDLVRCEINLHQLWSALDDLLHFWRCRIEDPQIILIIDYHALTQIKCELAGPGCSIRRWETSWAGRLQSLPPKWSDHPTSWENSRRCAGPRRDANAGNLFVGKTRDLL